MPRQIIHNEPPLILSGSDPENPMVIHFSAPELPKVGQLALSGEGSFDRGIEGTTSIVGPKNFELTMTDELHDAVKHNFGAFRRNFRSLIEYIAANPFDDTNIDAFKDTDAGQWARLVHRIEGPLADIIPGKKLALKSTGLDMDSTRNYLEYNGPHRSRLTEQFRSTLALQRMQQEAAPNGIDGCVFVNQVYGILRYGKPEGGVQEWMLMEHVQDATPMENIEVVMTRGLDLGFKSADHPKLMDLIHSTQGPYSRSLGNQELTDFPTLAEALAIKLNVPVPSYFGPFKDLNGNNVLVQETPAGKQYTIIDIENRGRE